MDLNAVESGHIEAIGWENETMMVRFKNGSEYLYSDVSFDTYESIKEASSVGAALSRSGLKGSLC